MTKVNELEKLANKQNLVLRKKQEALILKVPVPILYTEKGLIAQKSTVDFVGIIKGGKFIAYDAKETESKTSFPLSNIEQHQVVYLDYVRNLGGIAFFLIHFKKVHPTKAFIVPMELIDRFYWDTEGRKSIPLKDFDEKWLTPIDSYLEKIIELYQL